MFNTVTALRYTHWLFPGVEKCPAGWPISGQEPDTATNHREKKPMCTYRLPDGGGERSLLLVEDL